LTTPKAEDDAFWTAGAASERMKVAAEPFTAVSLAVAVGFAPVGAVTVLVTVIVSPVAPAEALALRPVEKLSLIGWVLMSDPALWIVARRDSGAQDGEPGVTRISVPVIPAPPVIDALVLTPEPLVGKA
jgi:hypothetical protein